jgi:lysophospholipase L1-like esterase
LQKLIDLARKVSDKFFFIGLPMIDENIVDPMPWDRDRSYHNDDIKKYDQALRDVAKENGAGYIPVSDKFEAKDYKKLLYDGAHPNSAGHELIFETVRDSLLERKII